MSSSPQQARQFYDQFGQKLLRDFVTGNPRTERAFCFALTKLAEGNCSRILDLGCGIGWSSFEMASHRPGTRVTAIDLSPNLVSIAKKVFSHPKVDFSSSDLTDSVWGASHENAFDACVMIDVYEHIPKEMRSGFHQSLSRVLAPNAMIVMTCPSIFHQDHLRKNNPQGLQPVDEDIGLDELGVLARDIRGEIGHFQYVDIWNKSDYFHAQLVKGPKMVPMENRPTFTAPSLISRSDRRAKLEVLRSEISSSDWEKLVKGPSPSALKHWIRKMIGR